MNAKEAVARAKAYVLDLFSDEGIIDLGLEEVEYDDADHAWKITLGFGRAWSPEQNALSELSGTIRRGRAYRVVTMREPTGEVVSVKIREMQYD